MISRAYILKRFEDLRVRGLHWLVPLLFSLAAIWPYLSFVGLRPVLRDATLWITRGAPSSVDWIHWVFAEKHFSVGYRPITALTYSLNHLMGGFDSWSYRVTDLALHVLCGLLIYGLCRTVARGSESRWIGFIASALFLMHPVADEVLPYLARRSYSLSTALLLMALLIAMGRWRKRDETRLAWPRLLGSALVVSLAVLVHEAALIGFVLLPVCEYLRSAGNRKARHALASFLVAVVCVALLTALRLVLFGNLGGYADTLHTEMHVPLMVRAICLTPLSIVPIKDLARGAHPALLVVAGASVAVCLRFALAGKAGNSGRRLSIVGVCWFVALAVFYATQTAWFPRQAYLLVVPYALVIGSAFSGIRRSKLRTPVKCMAWFCFAALCGMIVVHSPSLRGTDAERAACWKATDAMLRELEAALRTAGAAETIGIVAPHFKRPAAVTIGRGRGGLVSPLAWIQPEIWAKAISPHQEIETLFRFKIAVEDHRLPIPFALEQNRLQLAIPGNVVCFVPGRGVAESPSEGLVTIDVTRPDTVFFHDGREGHVLRGGS